MDKKTWLSNGYCVSTVSLGSPISTIFDPMLSLVDRKFASPGGYETMVFPQEDNNIIDWGELDFARYSTEEEAITGHHNMVEKWKAK